jgi:hypothetical protein
MNAKKLSLVLVLLSMTCAFSWAQKVNVDWDKTATFTGFKTYTWAPGTPVKNPLMDQRIHDGIDQHLASKGLQKVESSADPDLVVIYHGAVEQQTQINTTSTGGGWGPYWGGGGMQMATTNVEQIPVGELVVDIGDVKTKKLLWRGTATDTVSSKPEKNTQKIDKALDKMFDKFPPPEKK